LISLARLARRAAGEALQKIARSYNVHHTTIGRLCSVQTWMGETSYPCRDTRPSRKAVSKWSRYAKAPQTT